MKVPQLGDHQLALRPFAAAGAAEHKDDLVLRWATARRRGCLSGGRDAGLLGGGRHALDEVVVGLLGAFADDVGGEGLEEGVQLVLEEVRLGALEVVDGRHLF